MAISKKQCFIRGFMFVVLVGTTVLAGCTGSRPPLRTPSSTNYFIIGFRPSYATSPSDPSSAEYLISYTMTSSIDPDGQFYRYYHTLEHRIIGYPNNFCFGKSYFDKVKDANLPIVKFNNFLNDPARDAPLKYIVFIPEKPKTLPAGMSAEKLWDLVEVYHKYDDPAALEKIWQDLVSAGYPYAGTVQIGDKKELPSWENW